MWQTIIVIAVTVVAASLVCAAFVVQIHGPDESEREYRN